MTLSRPVYGKWRRANAFDVKNTRRNASRIPVRFWSIQLLFMLFYYRLRDVNDRVFGGI